MSQLTVLYDQECYLCSQAKAWLSSQPSYLPFEFIPAGSAAAKRRYPELETVATREQLTVVAEDGRTWLGDAAWITCLWALRRHRAWALRLAVPALRPLARAFFNQVSTHRRSLSRFLMSAGVRY